MSRRSEGMRSFRELSHRLASNFGAEPAAEMLRALVDTCGGQRLTIPTRADLERERRDMEIRLAFDKGATIRELTFKHRLTSRRIKQILIAPTK